MIGWSKIVLTLVLSATMILAGCSLDWVGEAEEIVAVLIPAATNLVSLVTALEGKTVSAPDVAAIQSAGTQAGADLQLIQSLIAAYQKADDAEKPGLLNQIQSAMNAVQANLQGLLPALHIKDAATQTRVTAVVGVLLSEVQSLAAVVPLVQSQEAVPQVKGASHVSQKQRDMGHPRTRPRAPLSAREFVKSYNATLTAKTGKADLDRAAAGAQIHQHGAAARWASVGWLR